MSDTIELLTNIGRDASLRHASAEELASFLDRANASKSLKAAVAAGDSSLLSKELGNNPRTEPQISHFPGHEDEKPEREDREQGEDRVQKPSNPTGSN